MTLVWKTTYSTAFCIWFSEQALRKYKAFISKQHLNAILRGIHSAFPSVCPSVLWQTLISLHLPLHFSAYAPIGPNTLEEHFEKMFNSSHTKFRSWTCIISKLPGQGLLCPILFLQVKPRSAGLRSMLSINNYCLRSILLVTAIDHYCRCCQSTAVANHNYRYYRPQLLTLPIITIDPNYQLLITPINTIDHYHNYRYYYWWHQIVTYFYKTRIYNRSPAHKIFLSWMTLQLEKLQPLIPLTIHTIDHKYHW